MIHSTTREVLDGQPVEDLRAPSATVTVTLHDGRTVTVSTWSTCVGVGRFVTDLLGEPGARHTTTLGERDQR